MNYLDLFSGIGGFRLGLEKAWNKIFGESEGWSDSGGRCLRPVRDLPRFAGFEGGRIKGKYLDFSAHSEIDRYAEQIYRRHFPESEPLGDIRSIDPVRLPPLDLVTFGFPCQDLSVAGKRKGLGGERSGLFFEAMRIIRATIPKVFIFENVAGLFSSNRGWDFQACRHWAL